MYGKQKSASKVEVISGFIDPFVFGSSCTVGYGAVDFINSAYNFGCCNQTNSITIKVSVFL